MEELNQSYLLNPDTGSRSFLEKLHDQLEDVSDDAVRIAVDALAFHLLYPVKFGAAAKLELLQTILGWRPWSVEADLSPVEAAYKEGGIGYPGTFYFTGRPDHFAFLLQLGRLALTSPEKATDDAWIISATERALEYVDKNVGMQRNVALHLMFPDSFERIAVDSHKQQIVTRFQELTTPNLSIDDQLAEIRRSLVAKYDRPNFDFYDADIQIQWDPSKIAEPEPETPATEGQRSPKVWIEKTIVDGRPDRVDGDYSVGKMLWSPQRARNGADLYRFMRDVRPGDTVLHLTDNEALTGISIAESAAEEFNGLPETDWANRPSYYIRLRDYRKLDPPLNRTVFLQPPYREALVELLSAGLKNTFYSKDGNLNQGAYLTPAPTSVLSVLNRAYRSVTNHDLLSDLPKQEANEASGSDNTIKISPRLDLSAVVESFAASLGESHISFGVRHSDVVRSFVASLAAKRFVILTGLSGSGKTQLALKFGEWLGPGRSRVIAVRPDWTGPEQLLGYEDALQKTDGSYRAWYVPDALAFILNAVNDASSPYLLILDEMNLAHVERYFADVLSGLESSQPCIPNLVRINGAWRPRANASAYVSFPENLFIVGTVNVDETTYNFSPKVLDRANTIEFRVHSTEFDSDARPPVSCKPGPRDLVQGFLEIARDKNWQSEHPIADLEVFQEALKVLHAELTDGRFEFGHRVFFEATRFASMFAASGAEDWRAALDLVVLQKILPRLHGSRRNLEPTLEAIDRFCKDLTRESVPTTATEQLPLSSKRVQRFLKVLKANQFASFSD
jgi:MoxR-like ATPase